MVAWVGQAGQQTKNTGSSIRTIKKEVAFYQTEALIREVGRALKPLHEAGIRWTAEYDSDKEARYNEAWRRGKDAVKERARRLEKDGYALDTGRILGILVMHLSPHDKGMVEHLGEMVQGLRECMDVRAKQWRHFRNTLVAIQGKEFLPFPETLYQRVLKHTDKKRSFVASKK